MARDPCAARGLSSRLGRALQMLMRWGGLVAIVNGLLLLLSSGLQLIDLHIVAGVVISMTLAGLAALLLVRRRRVPLAVVGLLLAALLPAQGLRQEALFPGGPHWMAQAVHITVGVIALAAGDLMGWTASRPLGR